MSDMGLQCTVWEMVALLPSDRCAHIWLYYRGVLGWLNDCNVPRLCGWHICADEQCLVFSKHVTVHYGETSLLLSYMSKWQFLRCLVVHSEFVLQTYVVLPCFIDQRKFLLQPYKEAIFVYAFPYLFSLMIAYSRVLV